MPNPVNVVCHQLAFYCFVNSPTPSKYQGVVGSFPGSNNNRRVAGYRYLEGHVFFKASPQVSLLFTQDNRNSTTEQYIPTPHLRSEKRNKVILENVAGCRINVEISTLITTRISMQEHGIPLRRTVQHAAASLLGWAVSFK